MPGRSRYPAAEKKENFPSRKSVHAGPPQEKILSRQEEASAFKGNAPRRSGDGRKKSPQHQRAGARRRSPQRGSAAAGAHIAREAGRCAPTCPLRRAADKVHDMRQRRPPPHGTRGSTGVVGGVEGLAPLTPCRPPRRRPRPDAGLKPLSSGKGKEKREKESSSCPAAQATTPRCRAEAASQRQKRKPFLSGKNLHAGENSHAGNETPRRSGDGRKKSPRHQRAGARRRSPQRGSAAAGAHITREAGRCAPTCPLRRAADKVHDMRQRRPPPHETRGSTGGVGGVEGLAPLTPCRPPRRRPRPDAGPKPLSSGKRKEKREKESSSCPAAQATTPGCRAAASIQRQKRKKKERNRPPRQASSVSRTTSRMSGSLRISSMS